MPNPSGWLRSVFTIGVSVDSMTTSGSVVVDDVAALDVEPPRLEPALLEPPRPPATPATTTAATTATAAAAGR